MRNILIFVCLVLALTAARATAGEPEVTRATLSVTVTGVENAVGKVSIGVYDKAEGWPKKGSELVGQNLESQAGEVSGVFSGLEPGTYAVAVFHDENGNSRLDRNFLGIPKEGCGFSRDAAATFGPPDFADAAFSVDLAGKSITLRMRY